MNLSETDREIMTLVRSKAKTREAFTAGVIFSHKLLFSIAVLLWLFPAIDHYGEDLAAIAFGFEPSFSSGLLGSMILGALVGIVSYFAWRVLFLRRWAIELNELRE